MPTKPGLSEQPVQPQRTQRYAERIKTLRTSVFSVVRWISGPVEAGAQILDLGGHAGGQVGDLKTCLHIVALFEYGCSHG